MIPWQAEARDFGQSDSGRRVGVAGDSVIRSGKLPSGFWNFQVPEDGLEACLNTVLVGAGKGIIDCFGGCAPAQKLFHHCRSTTGGGLGGVLVRSLQRKWSRWFRHPEEVRKNCERSGVRLLNQIGEKPLQLGAVLAGLNFPLCTMKADVVFLFRRRCRRVGFPEGWLRGARQGLRGVSRRASEQWWIYQRHWLGRVR